ncbi:MAG: ComEC/Rec2 family competence protein [Planctomycetota bacterium]
MSCLHRYPCVAITGVAILGIVIDSFCFDSLRASVLAWASITLFGSVIPWLARRASGPRAAAFAGSIATALAVMAGFGVWHAWDEHRYRSASLSPPVAGEQYPMVVRGRLKRGVTLRPNPIRFSSRSNSPWQSQLEVELESLRVEEGFREATGNVLVFVDGDHSHLLPGDRLQIYGLLHGLAAPTNPGAADLREFYRRKHLHGRIEAKNARSITLLQRASPSLERGIAMFAKSGRESLLRHTDDVTGPLAIALVIGQREFVNENTRNALLATGTAHLLSVSGLHLAIIVLVVGWLVSALGWPTSYRLAAIVGISVLYMLVTGNRPPVMRAAILVGALLVATALRRTSPPLNLLGAAALVLIVANPLNVFAVGVHLSFLAVGTLMMVGRPINRGTSASELELQRELRFRALVEDSSNRFVAITKSFVRLLIQTAQMSACVTAVSFPLVWSQFHMVSLVSVLTNVLIWSGLMLALPAGVLTVLLDPVHPLLGAAPGWVCHSSLGAMWWVVDGTSAIRFGHFWLPAPPNWMVWLFYSVLVGSLPWQSRNATRLRIAWVFVWGVAALMLALRPAPLPENTLEATFIDVGHGTSVVLRTPDSGVWLYDCGSMGNDRGTGQDIDSVLWSMGISHLDGVFLSHADADHYNALPSILQRFSVGAVYTPPGMLDESEPRLAALRAAIAARKIEVRQMVRGDLVGESTKIIANHPPIGGVDGSDNANSLVLRLDHGGTTLLLPGDLEPPGTEVLISMDRPIPQGVLMAPHHGSLSMNADAVLAWARPGEVVVSGGRRSAREEVRQMLSMTGSGVHGTAESGAIRIRIGETGKIEVRSWLTDRWR